MSDVPSPGRRSAPPAEPSRNGPAQLPWESALYGAVAALEDRLAACNRAHAELRAELEIERARVRECRSRLENWKLRQAAWARERNELLERLGTR